jgi:hypothetical protein
MLCMQISNVNWRRREYVRPVDAVLTKVLGSNNANTTAGKGTEVPGALQSQVATEKKYVPPSLAL